MFVASALRAGGVIEAALHGALLMDARRAWTRVERRWSSPSMR
jgi:hypothetical protein